MTLLDWLAVAVVVGGLVFLRRYIVALGRGASVAARKRPVLWSVPLVLLGLLVAWKGPEWQLASRQALLTPTEYLELQNSYRVTIVQALGGLFLLLGLYLTWRRVTATEQQVMIAGEGQITERFTRAIEQLGSDKLAVRLGGIYALERIARDSERDHWPIMEVLTAYVRENAPRHEEETEGEEERDPEGVATDIQAILTVIGRRRVEFDPVEQRLNLRRTNLSGANLMKANLSRANLLFAHLFGADLSGADLSEANLYGVNLSEADASGANLSEAQLPHADLSGAELVAANLTGGALFRAGLREACLREANLAGADLSEADLTGADLTGAELFGADLSAPTLVNARGLTREQIESAITDESTMLPDYLKEGGEESAEEAGGEAS